MTMILTLVALVLTALWGGVSSSEAQAARAPFSYTVDRGIRPTQAIIVGLDGRAPSAIGVVIGPDGKRTEFTTDEVVFQPKDAAALRHFVRQTGATIQRVQKLPSRVTTAPPPDWHLLRVNLSRLSSERLVEDMRALGRTGAYRVSSPETAKLLALIARSRRQGLTVGVNLLLHGSDFIIESVVNEHPDGAGGFINYATFGFMTDALDLPNGNMGIGVVKAWDYLRYKGIPFGKTYTIPKVAIVDGGFALDANGSPSPSNPDYPAKFEQINTADKNTSSAGGKNPNSCSGGGAACDWHGNRAFSVTAARPRNQFGVAGTAAEIPSVLLIKVRLVSFDVGYAINNGAGLHGASVINMSFGGSCGGDFCGWLLESANSLKTALAAAINWASAVPVVAAGNDGKEIDGEDDSVPCTYPTVICVGAVDMQAKLETYSNFGKDFVTIYAPDLLLATPDPSTAGAIVRFNGTSAAAPFVSGVVALMKALNPALTVTDVRTILQSTALPSPDARVVPGYINAFAAVQAVRPNLPPTIKITKPVNGQRVTYGTSVPLVSSISDPEQEPNIDGVLVDWVSDKDGVICPRGANDTTPHVACDSTGLSPGTHVITATVTDPYGAKASDTVTITAGTKPMEAYILYPLPGDTVFSAQAVNLRGYAYNASIRNNQIALTWSSNLGPLSPNAGGDVWTKLPVGDNLITLTAAAQGLQGTAQVLVHVKAGNDVPTVKIDAPADQADIPFGQVLTLVGEASDPVDGALGGASLVWSSTVDGTLGTGTQVLMAKPLTGGQCAPVVHHLTLKATNKAGFSATHTRTIWVGGIC